MAVIDLRDVTLIIPVMIDSGNRFDNLQTVISYTMSHLRVFVNVWECDFFSARVFNLPKKQKLSYKFVKSEVNYFYRTKIINDMVKEVNTPIVCIYDADVVMPPNQYFKAAELIRNKKADMVIPYDGTCYDLPECEIQHVKDSIGSTLKFDNINLQGCRKRRSNSIGGAIFFNRDSFIKGGMENENFKGWGAEDDEILHRFHKLGYKHTRIQPGILYHLYHPRTINSSPKNEYYRNNVKELKRIRNMNHKELRKEVNTWSWVSKYI